MYGGTNNENILFKQSDGSESSNARELYNTKAKARRMECCAVCHAEMKY